MDAVYDLLALTQQHLCFVEKFRVAAEAIVSKRIFVSRPHDDRFVKILQRECFGVEETVFSFGEPLGQEFVGKMAVDAGRGGVVAGFLPGVELRLHDMAIHARLGVGTEVRETLSVPERKEAKPEDDPKQRGW